VLFVVCIEDFGVVGRVEVIVLVVFCCWVVDLEEEFEDVLVGDLFGVEDDFDCFGVIWMVCVCGVVVFFVCVVDACGDDFVLLV